MGIVYTVFIFSRVPVAYRDDVSPILKFENLMEDVFSSDQIIRVAIYPSGGFAPGILANGGLVTLPNSIYDKEEKIRVEFIIEEDPIRCFGLLYEKKADIAWSNVSVLSWLYAKYRSINPVAVMMYGFSSGEEIIFAHEPIKQFTAEMKPSIACVKWGAPHFLVLALLNENGITHNAIRWHFTLSNKDALYLLQKGKVSIAAVSSKEKDDVGQGHLVISSSHVSALSPGVFIMREDFNLTKHKLVEKFISGWFKGVDEMKKSLDPAVTALAASFGVDDSAAKFMLNEYVIAGLKDNFEFFGSEIPNKINFDRLVERVKYYYFEEGETVPASMLRNTELLNKFINQKKPSLCIYPAVPVLTTTTLEKFIQDEKVFFKAGDYTLDITNAKILEKFSEKAVLFQNAKVFLYGDAAKKEAAVYNYAWGMRFYIIKKFLSDYGVSESRIAIKEITHTATRENDTDAVLCAMVP